MSTCKNTAPAIRPQGDTHPEGIQAALDVLLNRRSALAAMWAEAAKRHDATQLLEIGGRQAEVAGMIRALRAGGAG
jgi:hypothetical protein